MDATLRSVFEIADPAEVVAIAERLTDLPEFGLREQLAALSRAMMEVRRLEKQLAGARDVFRATATKLLLAAVTNWTPAEIETATGYAP